MKEARKVLPPSHSAQSLSAIAVKSIRVALYYLSFQPNVRVAALPFGRRVDFGYLLDCDVSQE